MSLSIPYTQLIREEEGSLWTTPIQLSVRLGGITVFFLFHESNSHPPLAPDEHLKNFRLFFYFKDAISILCRDETPSEGVVNDYSNKTPNRRSQRLRGHRVCLVIDYADIQSVKSMAIG